MILFILSQQSLQFCIPDLETPQPMKPYLAQTTLAQTRKIQLYRSMNILCANSVAYLWLYHKYIDRIFSKNTYIVFIKYTRRTRFYLAQTNWKDPIVSHEHFMCQFNYLCIHCFLLHNTFIFFHPIPYNTFFSFLNASVLFVT